MQADEEGVILTSNFWTLYLPQVTGYYQATRRLAVSTQFTENDWIIFFPYFLVILKILSN